MSDFDRPVSTTPRDPLIRPIASRAAMTTTGPTFSTMDMVAGIVAALMTLGPLAMAAFAVGRH
jgi:hypothetical protein